jgi:hypothetical protein
MADNTQLPIPTTAGDVIASDEIGGVKFQRVKFILGANGVNDGPVSFANPLPVTGAITVNAGTNLNTSALGLETTQSSINTKLPSGLTVTANKLLVDGSGSTQPVSGTVTANTGLSQPLTDAQLRASAVPVSGAFFQATQPVSAASLPLPSGAATEATLSSLNTKIATSVNQPDQNAVSLPVRQSPHKYFDASFPQTGSGLQSPKFTQIGATGSGMAINQSSGNLVITTGTTINSEITLRATQSFTGALTAYNITTLSQRIINNNFFVELVDVIGDGLAYTIVNATTVNVTKTAHGYTALNVGQRMDIGAITGAAGIPMEAVIASIPDVNTIQFTVAGWPATGSGTCSLTGWNKIELNYTNTLATAVNFNTRRQGWQNTAVAATILTTASGVIASVNAANGLVSLSDQLTTSAGVLTNRGSWRQNIPEPDVVLFLQLRARNGTVAPATTTTWTVGMCRVENYVPTQVDIVGTRQQSLANSLPTTVVNTVPTTISSGTVTTVSTLTGGSVAEDAATATNPIMVGGVVRTTTAPITLVAGDACRETMTSGGAVVQKPFSVPEADWFFASAAGGITNTTDVVLKAAAGASLRNYLTSISIQNGSATVSTEVIIKDGATTIWRGTLGTSALLNSAVNMTFSSPLKTTANTALNVACAIGGAAVFVNAQGYVAV